MEIVHHAQNRRILGPKTHYSLSFSSTIMKKEAEKGKRYLK